jgi:hypothetical protein
MRAVTRMDPAERHDDALSLALGPPWLIDLELGLESISAT